MSNDTSNNVPSIDDSALDKVELGAERLPTLEVGTYFLDLFDIVHVDGDNGVFDIFQFNVLEAQGETANPAGSKAKISFKRYGPKEGTKQERDMADKKIVSILQALNGGEVPDSAGAFLKDLRTTPSGKVRARVTTAVAEKSGRTYKKFSYNAA